MNLFIDTNIYLSFYHLTSDDLEELKKLKVLLDKDDLVLYVPNQIKDEYLRNRENKIAAALKSLKEQKLNLQFPALCKDYEEYSTLRELQRDFEKQHSSLMKQISADIKSNSLKADKVIKQLFEKANNIETKEEVLIKASMRMDIGNPPGKKGSLGDAINWETLLAEVPNKEDLYLIADDRDYFSIIDNHRPKEFLDQEWKQKKESEVLFYRRISPFFKEHYPDIKLASELEKEVAVQQLVGSNNFASTHSSVSKLSKYEGFSGFQINEIVDAALTNSQVNWIIGDVDIFEFFTKIITEYKDEIEEEACENLKKELSLHESKEIEDDDIPF